MPVDVQDFAKFRSPGGKLVAPAGGSFHLACLAHGMCLE